MSIEITARHMDETGGIQNQAREKAEDLIREFPRVEHVHVILDREKHRQKAEFFVQAKNHIRVEADATTDHMQKSIHEAHAKVERQLRRLRDKVLEHRPKRPEPRMENDEAGPERPEA